MQWFGMWDADPGAPDVGFGYQGNIKMERIPLAFSPINIPLTPLKG
jgi:hypothetical protein